MASASSLLSEEQFRCSICLDVLKHPVSTPCGHNYCKTCITQHWDVSDMYTCPVCNKLFHTRPELQVNTLLSEMADQFRSVRVKDSSHPDQPEHFQSGEVCCDFCTETKMKAVKSCLVCMTSYCETHLEPHQRIPRLKIHQLLNPVENLEDRMCKKHGKPLEMFCKTDQVCVCQFCRESDHKLHLVVPLKEEYEGKKAQLGQTEAEVHQMIQEKRLKIQQIQHSVKLSKDDADRQISEGVKVFTALMHDIEESQAELISTVQDKHKSTERQAEGFITELEQELMELTKRSSELEKLSHTEDHLHLIQSLPSLTTPPDTKDWTKVHVQQPSYVGTVRRALEQLKKTLSTAMEKPCIDELKKVQQDAVDVTLDPDTAHPKLILSEDGKQVYTGVVTKNLPYNPARYSTHLNVVAKQSFSSGRFYYEVEVIGKTDWYLGVARKLSKRKKDITYLPRSGFWTIRLRNGDRYEANAYPPIQLSVKEKLQKVGVFANYEEGLVSFYDVKNSVHIYSFTKCSFIKQPLHPFFSPTNNESFLNSVVLIITPVNISD